MVLLLLVELSFLHRDDDCSDCCLGVGDGVSAMTVAGVLAFVNETVVAATEDKSFSVVT